MNVEGFGRGSEMQVQCTVVVHDNSFIQLMSTFQ